MSRRCPHCDHEIRVDARFCDACGKAVAPPADSKPLENPTRKLGRGKRDSLSPAGVGYRSNPSKGGTDLGVPTASGAAAPPSPDRTSIAEGVVRGLKTHVEQDEHIADRTWHVWVFRLERDDDRGNRVPPVLVQMRGRSFDGAVHDGDLVQVIEGEWRGSGLLAKRLHNLETKTVVVTKGEQAQPLSKLAMWVIALVLIVFMGSVIYSFITDKSDFEKRQSDMEKERSEFEEEYKQAEQLICDQARRQGVQLPGC